MNEVICNALQEYGWSYKELGESTVITGFVSDLSNNPFTIIFLVNEEWITIMTSDLAVITNEAQLPKVALYLSNANYCSSVAKFSISDQNEIVISIEFPTYGLTKQILLAGLEILCGYIDQQTDSLRELLN